MAGPLEYFCFFLYPLTNYLSGMFNIKANKRKHTEISKKVQGSKVTKSKAAEEVSDDGSDQDYDASGDEDEEAKQSNDSKDEENDEGEQKDGLANMMSRILNQNIGAKVRRLLTHPTSQLLSDRI
jgi:hypothetical protein